MRIDRCYNIVDFRSMARRRLPGPIFHYIDGAADDEVTYRRNTEAYERCDLVPNVLAGVESIEMSITVMGQKLDMPLFCAPTALQRLFHHDGEWAVAKAAEKFGTLQLLLNELNHGVKNTLATVQAIASQSMRTLPRENVETFSDRLVALSRAHDLLMQRNWKGMELREIVDQALAPLCAKGPEGRLVIEGPAVRIPANNVASWSMALHELCMNAFKHGALKMDAGTVKIIWSAPEQGRLRFRWSEHGGPPATIPKHRGFGSSLIESLGRELAGSASLRFDPEGLVCTIDALLPAAQDHL